MEVDEDFDEVCITVLIRGTLDKVRVVCVHPQCCLALTGVSSR